MQTKHSRPLAPSHLQLLILQPTPFCNIDCDYCYLSNRLDTHKMSPEILQRTLDIVLGSGLVTDRLSIVWHAGEPLAVPIKFYENALACIERQTSGLQIIHSLQTNGTLVNDRWCHLFKQYDIRIGVSIDGPEFIHDKHRKDRDKKGTHCRVMRGIECLQQNGVPFHAIAVVTVDALDHPDEVFGFFLGLGAYHVGFNIEELEGAHHSSTLSDKSFDNRLRQFFQRLYSLMKAAEKGPLIREFEHALAAIAQGGYANAKVALEHNQQAQPLSILSVDYQGNISTFSPELLGARRNTGEPFQFGNVLNSDLLELLENEHFLRTLEEIKAGVHACEARCQYFLFCGGGAPANKYFENGTFASDETMYCRHTIKAPIDIVLEDLEKRLGLVAQTTPQTEPSSEQLKNPQLRFSGRDKLVQINIV